MIGPFPLGKFWRSKWGVLLFLALTVATIFILRKSNSAVPQYDEGPIFGTVYHIKYKYDHNLNKEILAELDRVDNSMSIFNPTSTISKINAGTDSKTDELFREVFSLAEDISKETNGAFDITVAPLVNAWGFGFKNQQLPTKLQVDSLRSLVGFNKVSLDGIMLKKKDPRVMLDCGAIAKGFGVDCVARLSNRLGISDYMIEIGGEVRTHGKNFEGKPWTIGIQRPLVGENEVLSAMHLQGKALATSGNYRNFYVKNGHRYAHTIDPRTGYPVQHSLLSASVIASDCATADAYATSFMVLGLDGAKKILSKHPELKAYLIYEQNGKLQVWMSPGLEKNIVE